MTTESQNTVPAKVELTVSGILNDLSNGLSRAMIQAKYSLSGKDLKALFAHPKLKGKKTIPAPSFVLIDDTAEEVEAVEAVQDIEVVDEREETLKTEPVPAWDENVEQSNSI